MSASAPEVTTGTLLGGRVRYDQPAAGFRTGIEPVLLAAAVAARPGERVLEAGSGAGAGLLCLAARVPGLRGIGVERDTDLTALAARNAAANRFPGIENVTADILAWRGPAPFDHAFANPPYHPPGTASPLPAREAAKRAAPGLIAAWIAALVASLRDGGTLTLSLPSGAIAEAVDALHAAGCGTVARLPLFPRENMPPKLELLRATRGAAPCPPRTARGLILHPPLGEPSGGPYTIAAENILRHGAALDWETSERVPHSVMPGA